MKLIFIEELKVFQFDGNGDVIEEEIAKVLHHDNLCSYIDSDRLEYQEHQLLYLYCR